MNHRSISLVHALAACVVTASLAACGTTPAVPGSALAPTDAPVPPTLVVGETSIPATIAIEPTVAATAQPAPTSASTASGGAAMPEQFNASLRGTIGDLPVQMALQRNGDEVRAQYFYENIRNKTGFEESSYLFGSIAANGALRLGDSEGNSATTVFSGTLQQNAPDQLTLNGTWTSAQNHETVPAQLTEVQPPQTTYTISTKTTYANDQAHHATYKAAYPQLDGAGAAGTAFNKLVEDSVSRNIADFQANVTQILSDTTLPQGLNQSSIEITYETTYASDHLISVLFHQYSYSAGAAHPNSTSFAVTYDLAHNRQLALADLFTPGSNYLVQLSDYNLQKLRTRDYSLFEEGAAPKEENFRSWNIEEQGLRITFDAYQVAAYAAGPQVLFVPYSTLRLILDPNGPLQSVAQR